MISVIYDRQNFTLTVRGHAKTAEYGHDLVCAAASVLLHTYSSAADLLYNRGYAKHINRDISSGNSSIGAEVLPDYDEVVRLALDAVVSGYEFLAARYPDAIEFLSVQG